jgi:two-component system CheB/CheR fusion protein
MASMPHARDKKAEDPLGLGRPLRALLVEDDKDTREMFALLLGGLGWHVTAAHSGPDALTRFDPSATDVILTDLGLPEMDGYELLASVRERAPLHIPVIAITGYGTDDEVARAISAGFDGHLAKPFEIAALLELLWEIGGR